MAHEYLSILILALVGIGLAGALTLIAVLLGPKSTNPSKRMPFEAGMPSTGSSHGRFNIKFYMIAMIFLIFDVEIIFLYPWAVKFRELGWFGFSEVMVFFSIFVLALAYVWKKGALEWE